MEETLILVDDNDNPIGYASREECHNGKGKRHRAFSVFLFDNKRRILLQFRNKSKLGGERWDSAAISHVRKGETYETAAERSMKFELGIAVPVEKIFGFTYTESYDGYSENEYCAILVGKYDGKLFPNKQEIDHVKFSTLDEVKKDMDKNSVMYTKWFREAFPLLLQFLDDSGYLDD